MERNYSINRNFELFFRFLVKFGQVLWAIKTNSSGRKLWFVEKKQRVVLNFHSEIYTLNWTDSSKYWDIMCVQIDIVEI